MTASKKLLLIDGNNLFHRAYHALPPLTDKTGENANAVFGFSNMLIKAVDEVKPTYIACAFDTKAPTFRHVGFAAYKAQRVAPPPDLYPQLPKVKAVLDAFGIKYFEKAGYEADDLLASIAAKVVDSSSLIVHGEKKKSENPMNDTRSTINIVIISGDRDLLQLVDGKIKVQAPGWNLKDATLFGSAEVKEKYGVTPQQMVDWKALVGDPSDNIPGIAGIGPKTASDLIQKYGSVEGIFEQLDNDPVSLGKLAAKLEAGRENAVAAKKLIELDTTVDLGSCLPAGRFRIEELRYQPDMNTVLAEYEKLGFKSIVAKLKGSQEKSSFAEASEDRDDKSASNQLELI